MNTTEQTEAFYLAYNEVRMAVSVSNIHASKADRMGTLKMAAYGARKASEAMRLAGGLIGKVQVDFLSYAREMTALNDVLSANVETARIQDELKATRLALRVLEAAADDSPIWA